MESATRDQRHEQIMLQLKTLIGEIIGDDVVAELGINYDSVFTQDLEMDSIELVKFAEKVKNKYGQKIDFMMWLTKLGMENLYKLTMGEVVDYIVARNGSNK